MYEKFRIAKRPHQVLNDASYIINNGVAQFAVSKLPESYGETCRAVYEKYRDWIVVNPDNLYITFAVSMFDGTLCTVCKKYSDTEKIEKCNSPSQIDREAARLTTLGFTERGAYESLENARLRGDVAGFDYVSARILFARLGVDLS